MLRIFLSPFVVILIMVGCAGPEALTESGEVIPSNTNRINIQTDDSLNIAFRNFGNILQMEGYSIESSDQDLGSIKTSKKNIHSHIITGNVDASLYATVLSVNNSIVIQLRGTCYWGDEGSGSIRVYGQESSPIRRCWNEMYSISKKYDDANLEFDTR